MHPELKAYLDDYYARTMARYDAMDRLHDLLLSKLLAGVSTPQPAHPMGTAADGGLADDASVPAVAPATFSATTQAQEDPAVAHDEPLVCIEMAPATCSTVCPTQVVTITNVDEVHDAATTVFLEPAVDLFHQEVEQLTPVPPIASVDEVHNAATTVRFEPTVDLFHLGIEQQGQLLRPAPWPSFVCHSESTYVQAAVGNFWLVFCPTGQFWCCWQYEQQWPPTVPARGCVYTDFGYVWWPPDHQLRMRNELQAWLPPTRHATGVVHLSQNVKNTGTLSAELSSQYGLQLMQFKHDRVPDPMDEPLNCLQDEQLQPWYSPDHATHNPEVQSTRSHLQNAMERWAFDISASFHVTELEGISHHIFFAIHNCCLFSWDCCNMEMVVTAASQQDQRHYHGRQPDAHYILQLKGSAKHFFEFFSRKFTLMENLEKNNSEISVICTSASVVHNSNKITCPWVQSEDASTKFGELGTWPQLDYATKSVLVQDIEKHLNQSVQRRGLDISAGFSQEELEGISYHGTFAIHTAYLISCLSRPCPWPSFDCFHEGAQLRYTWPKISYVLHHFAGALNSLTESLRCCQGVHLKLLCSSFSSTCHAGDVVSEQYFVNYILILMKIQHRTLHSLYFVNYKWEQSIPQDWEWLLSSAEHFCRLPGAKLQSGRPPDRATAANIIQMLPVRVRISHMGHWFRPRPWPFFKYDSNTSHPEESCSGIRGQPHDISGFSSGLFLLWFTEEDCFPVCCCELISMEKPFVCLRCAQLPSDATQETVRIVTVSIEQQFFSQDAFKWCGHFAGSGISFTLGGAVLTSFYIESSKCSSQQLGDLLVHQTCLTVKHTVSSQPWSSNTKTCFASRSRHLSRSHFHAYQNGSSFRMSWDPGNHIMSNLEKPFSCFQGTQLQCQHTPDWTKSGAIKSSGEEAIQWEQVHYKDLQFSPYSLEQPLESDEKIIPYQTTYGFDLEGSKIKSDCSLYFGTHLVGTRLLLIELESYVLADSKSMPYACIACMSHGFASSRPATHPVHEFGYNNKALQQDISWKSGSSPTGYSFHNHSCRYPCCIVEELNSMRVQNPEKSNGQHAASIVPRALHSCLPWDPGGFDFARMQDFEYHVLFIGSLSAPQNCSSPHFQGKNFSEPAANGHRLGGKPVVKEKGMSATQILQSYVVQKRCHGSRPNKRLVHGPDLNVHHTKVDYKYQRGEQQTRHPGWITAKATAASSPSPTSGSFPFPFSCCYHVSILKLASSVLVIQTIE